MQNTRCSSVTGLFWQQIGEGGHKVMTDWCMYDLFRVLGLACFTVHVKLPRVFSFYKTLWKTSFKCMGTKMKDTLFKINKQDFIKWRNKNIHGLFVEVEVCESHSIFFFLQFSQLRGVITM